MSVCEQVRVRETVCCGVLCVVFSAVSLRLDSGAKVCQSANKPMLQCVLQCVAVCVAVCCSVCCSVHCIAVCCSVLQCVGSFVCNFCNFYVSGFCSKRLLVSQQNHYDVLQCVAVCYSVLAVWCRSFCGSTKGGADPLEVLNCGCPLFYYRLSQWDVRVRHKPLFDRNPAFELATNFLSAKYSPQKIHSFYAIKKVCILSLQ